MAGIETRVVEGVHADESLMIVSSPGASFVIVKGAVDNIAIELDEDGWHRLAVVAMEQGVKAEVPDAMSSGLSLVASWMDRAMMQRGMDVRDMAEALRVDMACMRSVFREEAHLPDELVRRASDILDLPPMGFEHASRLDRERFPDRPDAVVSYGGSSSRVRRGKNKPKRWDRKETSRGRGHGRASHDPNEHRRGARADEGGSGA